MIHIDELYMTSIQRFLFNATATTGIYTYSHTLSLHRALPIACLPLALGPLEDHRLALDVPALTKALGELIRNGTLGATQYELAANAPLRRVAWAIPTAMRATRARLPSSLIRSNPWHSCFRAWTAISFVTSTTPPTTPTWIGSCPPMRPRLRTERGRTN